MTDDNSSQINYRVTWDFDGPINDITRDDKQSHNCTNNLFLTITLNILSQNNVQTIINTDKKQSDDIQKIYEFLDTEFTIQRSFLKREQEAQPPIKNHRIIFISGDKTLEKKTHQSGMHFIHAKRNETLGSIADNAYLFEVLLQTVGIQKTLKHLKEKSSTFSAHFHYFEHDISRYFHNPVICHNEAERVFIDLNNDPEKLEETLTRLSQSAYQNHKRRQSALFNELTNAEKKESMQAVIKKQLNLHVETHSTLPLCTHFTTFKLEKQWASKSSTDPLYFILKAMDRGLTSTDSDAFFNRLQCAIKKILPQENDAELVEEINREFKVI